MSDSSVSSLAEWYSSVSSCTASGLCLLNAHDTPPVSLLPPQPAAVSPQSEPHASLDPQGAFRGGLSAVVLGVAHMRRPPEGFGVSGPIRALGS